MARVRNDEIVTIVFKCGRCGTLNSRPMANIDVWGLGQAGEYDSYYSVTFDPGTCSSCDNHLKVEITNY